MKFNDSKRHWYHANSPKDLRLCTIVLVVLLAFACAIGSRVGAQVPQNISAKGINLPYFEGNNPKALFLAETADPIPGGFIAATDFRMYLFGKGGTNDVELIVETPKCTFDYATKRVWSPGSLEAYSTTTNYVIRGEGFICTQTNANSLLEISNKVHTIIQRETTNARPVAPIDIFSDRFRFISQERETGEMRVAQYFGHVFVNDTEMSMVSEYLRIGVPSGTNKVRNIYAQDNVVITNKLDGSRATGERAVYSSNEKGEVLRLSGKPTWRDGKNEVRGETFIFDRQQQIVFVQTNAHLKLPRGAVAGTGLLGEPKPKTKPLANEGTNQLVDVTAAFVEIYLPMTNRPARSLVARTNVVILSPADNSRATADRAVFEGATGVLELTGNAVWQTPEILAKGRKLTMDSSNRVFRSEEKAYLKMLSRTKKSSTNSFFEIFSQNYEVLTNKAKFRGDVRAEFTDGGTPSQLVCRELDVYFKSNQVELIVAVGAVSLEQRPNLATATNATQRTLQCERMKIKLSPETGAIKTLFAEQKAILTQRASAKEKQQALEADQITMNFGGTNQLENLLAERNVHVQSGRTEAWGAQAVYTIHEGDELFEITKDVKAKFYRSDKDETPALVTTEVLMLNPRTGKVRFPKGSNYSVTSEKTDDQKKQ